MIALISYKLVVSVVYFFEYSDHLLGLIVAISKNWVESLGRRNFRCFLGFLLRKRGLGSINPEDFSCG